MFVVFQAFVHIMFKGQGLLAFILKRQQQLQFRETQGTMLSLSELIWSFNTIASWNF